MFDYVFEWSNPAIWPDNEVPGPDTFVVIPDTMGIVLDDTSAQNSGALDILMIRGQWMTLTFSQFEVIWRP